MRSALPTFPGKASPNTINSSHSHKLKVWGLARLGCWSGVACRTHRVTTTQGPSAPVPLQPTTSQTASAAPAAAAKGTPQHLSGAYASSSDDSRAPLGPRFGSTGRGRGRGEANSGRFQTGPRGGGRGEVRGGGRGGAPGGGRGRGRDGHPGRGRGRTPDEGADAEGHRSGGRPAAGLPDDLNLISDLPALADLVEGRAAAWAATWRVGTFRAAFHLTARLGTKPGADASLCRRILGALAAAYLPLAPGLRDAFSCVAPLYACAKLGFWEEQGQLPAALLQRLGRDGGDVMQGATAQSHAHLWWAASEAPPHVVAAAEEPLRVSAGCLLGMTGAQIGPQACSNILLACSRLQRRPDPLLRHLTACLAQLPDASAQALANSLYALGELADDCGYAPAVQELRCLAYRVVARLREQQQQQQQQQQQRAPTEGGRGGSEGFVPQHISNMLLGCAKLGYADGALLKHLAAAVEEATPRFIEQGLSNVLYSLAALGCTGAGFAPVVQRLCSEVGERLQRQPDRFNPQHLYNILWALEGLRPEGVESLTQALAAECRRRQFDGFNPHNLSGCVWALARIHRSSSDGFQEADQDWYDAAVAAAVSARDAMAASKFQNWSNLWVALALVLHRPGHGLLGAMVDDPPSQQPALSGEGRDSSRSSTGVLALLRTSASEQESANLLWSLALLGMYEQRLVDVLAERLGELLGRQASEERPKVQGLANSLWALAMMGPAVMCRHSGLVEGMLREVVRQWEEQEGGDTAFAPEDLAQLWQVQQELRHVRGGRGRKGVVALRRGLAVMEEGNKAASLLRAMRDTAAEERLVLDSSTSRLQREVLGALLLLQQHLQQQEQQQEQSTEGQREKRHAGDDVSTSSRSSSSCPQSSPSAPIVAVLPEHPVEALCCQVDVVVELAGGRRVAVEVDGPSHFLSNPPYNRERTGRTQLRDRQLERVFGAGNVVSVPYWEWDVHRGQAAREEYLCGLLGVPRRAG